MFNSKNFRVYLNEDMVGVEIGAAVKNCLAIGAGIADGMGFGDKRLYFAFTQTRLYQSNINYAMQRVLACV